MKTWTARLDTDFKQSLTLKDSANAIFVLTGYTVTAEARSELNGALLETSTVTVTDAGAGELDVEFTDTKINSIGAGSSVVDLKVVRDSDSYIYRTEYVRLNVLGRVTA